MSPAFILALLPVAFVACLFTAWPWPLLAWLAVLAGNWKFWRNR